MTFMKADDGHLKRRNKEKRNVKKSAHRTHTWGGVEDTEGEAWGL